MLLILKVSCRWCHCSRHHLQENTKTHWASPSIYLFNIKTRSKWLKLLSVTSNWSKRNKFLISSSYHRLIRGIKSCTKYLIILRMISWFWRKESINSMIKNLRKVLNYTTASLCPVWAYYKTRLQGISWSIPSSIKKKSMSQNPKHRIIVSKTLVFRLKQNNNLSFIMRTKSSRML